MSPAAIAALQLRALADSVESGRLTPANVVAFVAALQPRCETCGRGPRAGECDVCHAGECASCQTDCDLAEALRLQDEPPAPTPIHRDPQTEHALDEDLSW